MTKDMQTEHELIRVKNKEFLQVVYLLFNLVHLPPYANAVLPPTLAFNPLSFLLPTLYLILLHPTHPFMFLAVFLYLVLPLSLTPSGSFNGMPKAFNSAALNYNTFFVLQGLSFSELSNPPFSLLDPYFDYVGVDISLNNSSLLYFLNVYAFLIIALLQQRAKPTLLPFFPPPEISLFREL